MMDKTKTNSMNITLQNSTVTAGDPTAGTPLSPFKKKQLRKITLQQVDKDSFNETNKDVQNTFNQAVKPVLQELARESYQKQKGAIKVSSLFDTFVNKQAGKH